MQKKGDSILYKYDFGDKWEHEINLLENDSPFQENSSTFQEKEMFPLLCIDGARSCPPEDVGGISGYYEFCKAIKNPAHEDYDRLMEWSGRKYESEMFFIKDVNAELEKYLDWSRDRCQKWLTD